MKKLNILILSLSLFLTQCSLLSDEPEVSRHFIFKNYTQNSYTNTTLSLGQISGNKILIHRTENVTNITPKDSLDYSLTSTIPSKKYDKVFLNFIKGIDDKGCFLFEFSNNQKLFIEVGYNGDFWGEIDAPNIYEIDITENSIYTKYKSDTIKGIAVEDYDIIR